MKAFVKDCIAITVVTLVMALMVWCFLQVQP
jgi:hypothetical protein